MYTPEIVGSLVEGLGSAQWGRKKTSAEAVVSLTKLGQDVLGVHAGRLASALLAELGGRLWDGKQALLEALGALAGSAPASIGQAAVVEALVGAAARSKAVYRVAALKALTTALGNFDSSYFDKV
jgi:proteasome component ECM29